MLAENVRPYEMKLKFKKQAFQTDAVSGVADCFAGYSGDTTLI